MPMGRVLFVLLLAVGVVLWWKHRQRGGRPSAPEAPPSGPSTEPRSSSPEAMLRCAECGVHLPASQSLPGRGGVFCCAAHRQQFEDRP